MYPRSRSRQGDQDMFEIPAESNINQNTEQTLSQNQWCWPLRRGQWLKVGVVETWQPVFDVQNSHKGVRKQLSPESSLWFLHICLGTPLPTTYIIFSLKKQKSNGVVQSHRVCRGDVKTKLPSSLPMTQLFPQLLLCV